MKTYCSGCLSPSNGRCHCSGLSTQTISLEPCELCGELCDDNPCEECENETKIIDLNNELIFLQTKINLLNSEYSELSGKISELIIERDGVIDSIDEVNRKIENIKIELK